MLMYCNVINISICIALYTRICYTYESNKNILSKMCVCVFVCMHACVVYASRATRLQIHPSTNTSIYIYLNEKAFYRLALCIFSFETKYTYNTYRIISDVI